MILSVIVSTRQLANHAPIPNWVGVVVLSVLTFGIILCLAIRYARRHDPEPILKRTKNPWRKYKCMGYRHNETPKNMQRLRMSSGYRHKKA